MPKEIALQVVTLYNHYRIFNRFLTPVELISNIAREVGVSCDMVKLCIKANGGLI